MATTQQLNSDQTITVLDTSSGITHEYAGDAGILLLMKGKETMGKVKSSHLS